ncbi:MAG TPA: hexitol phosphatase HxpB [Bacteroidales bacterium]|nr:hexitol phosphatase HxpB [Bacteroidales bacterium]
MTACVIFDMDGVIIDSEPLWRETLIEVFGEIGIKLTEDMCRQTMGMTTKGAVDYWYEKLPWKGFSIEEVISKIEFSIIEKIKAKGTAMTGVVDVMQMLKKQGIRMALASSSAIKVIETVLDKLDLRQYFELYHSAQLEAKGKPDPAVFLSTARMMNYHPSQCLVIEDSIHGVSAAIAAGMKVVAIPDPVLFNDKGFDKADLKLKSLKDFTLECFLSINN